MRAVLLPGWTSERRTVEQITIALPDWYRTPDFQAAMCCQFAERRHKGSARFDNPLLAEVN
jgi:hypothetical protein